MRFRMAQLQMIETAIDCRWSYILSTTWPWALAMVLLLHDFTDNIWNPTCVKMVQPETLRASTVGACWQHDRSHNYDTHRKAYNRQRMKPTEWYLNWTYIMGMVFNGQHKYPGMHGRSLINYSRRRSFAKSIPCWFSPRNQCSFTIWLSVSASKGRPQPQSICQRWCRFIAPWYQQPFNNANSTYVRRIRVDGELVFRTMLSFYRNTLGV